MPPSGRVPPSTPGMPRMFSPPPEMPGKAPPPPPGKIPPMAEKPGKVPPTPENVPGKPEVPENFSPPPEMPGKDPIGKIPPLAEKPGKVTPPPENVPAPSRKVTPLPRTKGEEISNVANLDKDNFMEGIKKGIVFVKFYSPTCGHCRALAPKWEELATKYLNAKEVKIAKVNCKEANHMNQELCKEQGVNYLDIKLCRYQ